jgi:hypothetical protein
VLEMESYPEGIYKVKQTIYPDGSVGPTMLVPLKKKWFWFGRYKVNEERMKLLYDLDRLDRGEYECGR